MFRIIHQGFRQSEGEVPTIINGMLYVYGWFPDENGQCINHAWYNITKRTYEMTDPAVCPACWEMHHRCKGKCS